MLGVSIHEPELTTRFAAARKVGFPLVSAAGEEFSRDYRITGVPTTILVNGNGVVERVWEGELTERLTTEIEKALDHPSRVSQKGYGTSTFTPPGVTST